MKTIGIDIASEDKPTGVCVIKWSSTGACVDELQVGKRTIHELLEAVKAAGTPGEIPIGIDAPFGFPLTFSDTVARMRTGQDPVVGDSRWRETENHVKQTKNALSSVTSLITNTVTSRCYPLRHGLAGEGCTDLIGYTTRMFEVYPAAALVSWGIVIKGSEAEPSYKKKGEEGDCARQRIMKELLHLAKVKDGETTWLQIPNPAHEALLDHHDDAIDALVSALVARVAVMKSRPTDPASAITCSALARVLQEGWIHLPPARSLSTLPQTLVA